MVIQIRALHRTRRFHFLSLLPAWTFLLPAVLLVGACASEVFEEVNNWWLLFAKHLPKADAGPYFGTLPRVKLEAFEAQTVDGEMILIDFAWDLPAHTHQYCRGQVFTRCLCNIYIYIHISLTIHMNHFVQSICNQVVGVSLRWNNARPKYEDPSDLHTLSDLVDSTVKMWNKFSPGSWGRFELRCVNMWSKACPCIQGSKWTRSVISFRYGPTPRLPRCSWYFLPAIVGH